jgi:DNA-binding Xre family transcriptional regulator
MSISYRPLFVLLASREIKKTDLMNLIGISSGTLARFAKNEAVSLDVIEKLCAYFDCQPSDIMEYVKDNH